MSVGHSDLPGLSNAYVAEFRKVVFKKAVEFVLSNQFVELSDEDLWIFQVLAETCHFCFLVGRMWDSNLEPPEDTLCMLWDHTATQ